MERLWTRGDGRTIRIADMSTAHLVNAIEMVERAAKRARLPPEVLYLPYNWLIEELASRVGEVDPDDKPASRAGCRLMILSGFLKHLVRNHGAAEVAVALDAAIEAVELKK